MSLVPFHAYFLLAVILVCSAQNFELYSQKALFLETFGQDWDTRWTHSSHSKYDGEFEADTPTGWSEPGLKAPEANKHYGIVAPLKEPVDPSDGLTIQYEVRFLDGITCGGAYLKFLTADPSLVPEGLVDSTPYSIMFGPDKCGTPGKVHLILRHKNPVNGTIEEKHLKDAPTPVADSSTHVYTLRLTADNKYEVMVDGASRSKGSLFDAFEPPINPPEEIPDPSDIKPADWVDEEEIVDPTSTKPEDWDDRKTIVDEEARMPASWLEDEPEFIADPGATKPADWNDEDDGYWEAPTIRNPVCGVGCGPWKPPMKKNPEYIGEWQPAKIKNPLYKGAWVQRTVPNPHHYHDGEPLGSIGKIGAVAIEIWTINNGFVFDNILISRDDGLAAELRDMVWKPKVSIEAAAAKEAAKTKAKSKAPTTKAKGSSVTTSIRQFITSLPALAPAQHYLFPVLDLLDERPALLLPSLLVPPLLLLLVFVFFWARVGKKEEADPDDVDEEEEEEEEPPPVPDVKERPRTSRKKAADETPAGAAAKEGGEVKAATAAVPAAAAAAKDDDDADVAEGTSTRKRRVPKAD